MTRYTLLTPLALFATLGCNAEPNYCETPERYLQESETIFPLKLSHALNYLQDTEVWCYLDGERLIISGFITEIKEKAEGYTPIRITIYPALPTQLNVVSFNIWHLGVATWVDMAGKKNEELTFTLSRYAELTCSTRSPTSEQLSRYFAANSE